MESNRIIMTIEINTKGTESFYREVVSVIAQYQNLLKEPSKKYKDIFKTYRNMGLCLAALFVLMLIIGITSGFSALTIVALVVLIIAGVMVVVLDHAMRKQVKNYLAEGGDSVLTLDENGVEIGKENSQTVRLAWDNVAFVRKLEEAICFFSKEATRIVIAVPAEHEQEIYDYLDDNSIDVPRFQL